MVREKSGALDAAARQAAGAVSYGRYQLIKKLAAGGMAEVYLARQQGLEGFEKLLVIKKILPHLATDEEFVQMFLNEARIAARFNNANIVQIYDLGKLDDSYFIAMEYVHGEDLGRIMRKAWNAGTWIAPNLALRVIAQACEGLYYAHTKTDESGRPLNVVHRDISPQNILVSFDGGVKIVDFGIAKAADQSSGTRNGTIKGKYAYMSPEQAQGKAVDGRTDVFALGLVLYELLTGVRPLKRDTDIQTLQAALACEIEPPSKVASVSDALDPVVMKALARDTEARYQTAREFQLAIEDFLVQNQLAASSVHLSEFMKQLFADRLEEEAKSGKPAPSATISQQSFPSLSAAPGTGPSESWDAPEGQAEPQKRRASGEPRRRSTLGEIAPPKVAEPEPEDPDDAPTTQEVSEKPRRQTGQQRRATGEARRISGDAPAVRRPTASGAQAARPSGRSRASSQVGNSGMPDAPPRVSEGRSRDESWKDANKPQPLHDGRRRGSSLPAIAVVLLLLGVGFIYRADIQKLILNRQSGGTSGLNAPTVSMTLTSNIPVNVEVNGETVGRTPLRDWGVKPGKVTVRYYDPAQGIDRTVEYEAKLGEPLVPPREDFSIARVQFKTDRAIPADVYLNGKRIGETGAAPISLPTGDYEFVAKADNDTLEAVARVSIEKTDRIQFVDFRLRRK